MFRDNPPPVASDPMMGLQSTMKIPFPQCLSSDMASKVLNPSTLQDLFQSKLQDEDRKLKQERLRNDDIMNSEENLGERREGRK